MASNSPFPIREHDYVWLITEGVWGKQPPKGAMLWVVNLFDVNESSLELGLPGKYACCLYENKKLFVSIDKLRAIYPGQRVKFELDKRTYTAQISKRDYYTRLIHICPLLNGIHTMEFPGLWPFMLLIDEKEKSNVI